MTSEEQARKEPLDNAQRQQLMAFPERSVFMELLPWTSSESSLLGPAFTNTIQGGLLQGFCPRQWESLENYHWLRAHHGRHFATPLTDPNPIEPPQISTGRWYFTLLSTYKDTEVQRYYLTCLRSPAGKYRTPQLSLFFSYGTLSFKMMGEREESGKQEVFF